VVVEQSGDAGDGLARDWAPADFGADRHYGYAAQWFGLAALTRCWWPCSAGGAPGWTGQTAMETYKRTMNAQTNAMPQPDPTASPDPASTRARARPPADADAAAGVRIAGAFSYFTYYVIKPTGGSTNYGALIDPQRPMPPVQVTNERNESVPLASMRGKWLMLMTDRPPATRPARRSCSRCARSASDRARTASGSCVWLIQDRGDVDDRLAAAYNEPYAGVRFLRMDRATIAQWLPAGRRARRGHDLPGRSAGQPDDALAEGPRPKKMSSDLKKLLKYSRIG
jgi:hypothetical protein